MPIQARFAAIGYNSMMSIYNEWGFQDNPFHTTALPASETGATLLLGREVELRRLRRLMSSPPKLATIEGSNGIGKTSLANVAAYQLLRQHLDVAGGPLFVPCERTFQLQPQMTADRFIQDVYLGIAQTLISWAGRLSNLGRKVPGTRPIERWLNAPELGSLTVGFQAVNISGNRQPTISTGFDQSGFRETVRRWLSDIFPEPGSGGIVCILDNLELLQTSAEARRRLEELRDPLLTASGLRWVLCGALGIVLGVASSPRLEGFLHEPIEVGPIPDNLAPQVLHSRVAAFSVLASAELPLTPSSFEAHYKLLRGNIRNTLSGADSYCQWVYDRAEGEGALPSSETEKHALYEMWLEETSERALQAVAREVRPRAWEVFDVAVELFGGAFSPSDFAEFGANSVQALRPHVRDLETASLLVSSQDEGDRRRKTIQVTPRGWLVQHARRNRDSETFV